MRAMRFRGPTILAAILAVLPILGACSGGETAKPAATAAAPLAATQPASGAPAATTRPVTSTPPATPTAAPPAAPTGTAALTAVYDDYGAYVGNVAAAAPAAAPAAPAAAPAAPAAPAAEAVDIAGFAFSKAATVRVGGTVTWTNRDVDAHDVLAPSGAFSSPLLHDGQTFSFTFDRAGVFAYYCSLHADYMKQTVTVR